MKNIFNKLNGNSCLIFKIMFNFRSVLEKNIKSDSMTTNTVMEINVCNTDIVMEIPNKKCQTSAQYLIKMWYSMQAIKHKQIKLCYNKRIGENIRNCLKYRT